MQKKVFSMPWVQTPIGGRVELQYTVNFSYNVEMRVIAMFVQIWIEMMSTYTWERDHHFKEGEAIRQWLEIDVQILVAVKNCRLSL